MKFSACLLFIPALLVGAEVGAEDNDFLDIMAVATGDCTPTNQCQAPGTPCCGGGSHKTLRCNDHGCSTACHKVVKYAVKTPCRATGDICEIALVPGDPVGWICKRFIKAICGKILDGVTNPTEICDSVGMCKRTGRRCDASLEDQIEDEDTHDEDTPDEVENADQIQDENEAKDEEDDDQIEDADQIEDEHDEHIAWGTNTTDEMMVGLTADVSSTCTATNKCELRGASCCSHSDHGTAACSRTWCETKCLAANVVKHCASKTILCQILGMGPEEPLSDLCSAAYAGICTHNQQHDTCKKECGKLEGKRCGSADVMV